MGRFLTLWRINPVAPFPTDPVELSKFYEKVWAVIDDLIEKGQIKEMGSFLDGTSGYTIGEGESIEIFKSTSMFTPFWEVEVNEIIPWEKTKETWRATLKAQAEATKK